MTADENSLSPSAIEETAAAAAESADKPAEETTETEGGEPAEAVAETEGKKDGEAAEGDSPKKPNRVSAKERIAELTRQKREAEKRAEAAEAKLKAAETPAPKRSDFTDADEYENARAKWAAKLARGDDAKHEAEAAKAEVAQAKAAAWTEQRTEILTRHADFDTVINAVPGDVFTQSVADAILESEMAADVAYVLAKDLSRARKFAAMTPLQQGREIGRIEAELAPKPRKLSSAPPPVETVGSGAPGSSPDPSKMSMAEYVRWRKSQKD